MIARAVRALNSGYLWMEGNPVTVMLVSLGLGGFAAAAVIGVAIRGEDTRAIVTRSACAIDPASPACQRVKRESDRERSLRDTCIGFYQVDRGQRLLRLTRCPDQLQPLR